MSFLLEGITAVTWQQAVMYVVGIILIWLAVKKEYEPSLLLPLGFGAILVNLPYSGVVDQMVQGKVPAAGIIEWYCFCSGRRPSSESLQPSSLRVLWGLI